VRANEARDRIHVSITDGAPARRPGVLAAAIDDSRVPLLATIIGVRNSILILELQPSVFFSLPFDRFDYAEADFDRGTTVRIQKAMTSRQGPSRFVLTRAAMSDLRYVPESGRPAIALPKNLLLREVPDAITASMSGFWHGAPSARAKSFTIAGLPGIEAVPGACVGNPPRWSRPDANEFVRLMQSPHPNREVFLGRDDRDFRIAPLNSSAFPVGSLLLQKQPVFRPSSPNFNEEPIAWNKTSFADCSIKEITNHCERAFWTVHDTDSGWWVNGMVQSQELGKHTVQTGPLFFERQRGGLSLRYDPDKFSTFGYPVQEILDALARAPGRVLSTVVAGPSTDRGIWVELAPGRLAELPGQLVTWRLVAREISLAEFAWSAFSPGDYVLLELASDRALRIDRVILREWRPGGAWCPR